MPFPFSAIVGQERLKQALLCVAVDPSIGGVLVMGDRGAGKSTAIRGLAALLPEISVIAGCAYGCRQDDGASQCERCAAMSDPETIRRTVPMVDLPLGAGEERVTGALDLERALGKGEKAFEPGLLARANGGFLYIDEVNLLEDHLVDLLLDVAASGTNVVERDGLSVRHPARFVLVGSGNPEEGELRPQFLDRFGLSVDVSTPEDLPQRIEIVRRRDSYDRDPQGFAKAWRRRDLAVRRKVVAARDRIGEVEVGDAMLERVARLCLSLGTDGLRGELVLMRTARAIAALAGRDEVDTNDLREAAPMALGHRLRRDPLESGQEGARVERAVAEILA
ncbi:magnesium chelatase ATPase subunit I [Aurantiacibacter spongiae]|uniref:Mg-protoporphyrin IX chelatase n=1 Tax=Aurantiacibacter spongiae TaxID=2488860 RepID=A0A3N5CTV8_9SPHN|nr:magnesium chelatase ATPase subunit I [Aurantiacibacter spongiae]RPF71746.1 magnesium chelatase ATPase subunit I [Aurantiacibacter spongiae]